MQGVTVWITGLPGAGKSTLARLLMEALQGRSYPTKLLDGDILRQGPNSDLDFSLEGRKEAVRRVGESALELARTGHIVIVAMVSPIAADRTIVRQLHSQVDASFIEVWVSTPLEVCEQRDPKGLYRRARGGMLKNMTGVDSPYQPPIHSELEISMAGGIPMHPPPALLTIVESRLAKIVQASVVSKPPDPAQ